MASASKSQGFRKPAPADAPLHESIRERWSPRAFSDAPIPRAALGSLVEAARWAPSCNNEQPWAFALADRYADPEGYARVESTLAESNRVRAGAAPVLGIAAARLTFARNGKPNRWAQYDTGQATAQMALQAAAIGLAVHRMGGFDADKARQLLGIPDGYEPMAALAIGYPADPAGLSPELRARELAPRQRRPAGEWVYGGRWGEPLAISAGAGSEA